MAMRIFINLTRAFMNANFNIKQKCYFGKRINFLVRTQLKSPVSNKILTKFKRMI